MTPDPAFGRSPGYALPGVALGITTLTMVYGDVQTAPALANAFLAGAALAAAALAAAAFMEPSVDEALDHT